MEWKQIKEEQMEVIDQMDEKVSIMVFGGDVPAFSGGWGPSPGAGCGSQRSAREDFEEFASQLADKYGEEVSVGFVDLLNDDLTPYPEVKKLMGRFNPPLIVINNEPRFHGGLSVQTISEVIDELLKQN